MRYGDHLVVAAVAGESVPFHKIYVVLLPSNLPFVLYSASLSLCLGFSLFLSSLSTTLTRFLLLQSCLHPHPLSELSAFHL